MSLMNALSLVTLYARTGSPKVEAAALRLLARLALEGPWLTLSRFRRRPRSRAARR